MLTIMYLSMVINLILSLTLFVILLPIIRGKQININGKFSVKGQDLIHVINKEHFKP